MSPYDNLWLREKRTRARPGIFAHLTLASQRWFDAVRHERIQLQTHDRIQSTEKALVELSSGPPHRGETDYLPTGNQSSNVSRRAIGHEHPAERCVPSSFPMYTYNNLVCINYLCIMRFACQARPLFFIRGIPLPTFRIGKPTPAPGSGALCVRTSMTRHAMPALHDSDLAWLISDSWAQTDPNRKTISRFLHTERGGLESCPALMASW